MIRLVAGAVMLGLAISANAAATATHAETEAVEMVSMNVPPMLIHSVTSIPRMTLLPDLQSAHVRPLVVKQRLFALAATRSAAQQGSTLPDAPSTSSASESGLSLEALPLATRFRRMTNERFNTSDGSFGDFAICYRLAKRYALQVVPGDPAPVKLPVSTLQNNMGVTVGMVVRVGR